MPLALLPLLAVTFVDVLGFSILIPLLPFYAQHFGASTQMIGYLIASVALCGLLSSPFIGALSDRLGRRSILLITQTTTTISYILLALASSLPMLFFARAIEGFASGGLGVTQAYVADVTEPEQRPQAYGLLGMTFGIGFIFGPALSGILLRYGYPVPLFTAAALSLCTIALTYFLLPESHTKQEERLNPFAALRSALSHGRSRRLLTLQFCFTLGFTMWVSVLALFMQNRLGFQAGQTSLLYAASGVIGAIMQGVVVGRLTKIFGSRKMLTAGLSCAVVAYASVAAVHAVPALFAIIAVWAVGNALTRPSMSTLLADTAIPSQRGALMGASDASNDLAFIIGPITATHIFAITPAAVGVLPAVLSLAAIAVATGLRSPAVTEQPA